MRAFRAIISAGILLTAALGRAADDGRDTTPTVVNLGEPTTRTSRVFVPESYREMDAVRLREELDRLKKSRDDTTDEGARQRVDNLISAVEERLRTGQAIDELIAEVAADVARIRGLRILEPVQFRIIDRPQLREIVLGKLDTELPPDYLPEMEFVFKVLGAIPERLDLRDMILDLLTEQVAGLYDDRTGVLYIVKDFDVTRAVGRVTLAHEICHALQDQHFDLSSFPLRLRDNDDQAAAAAAVVEGDATILMQEYAARHFTGADVLQLLDLLTISQETLDRTPYFMRQALIFPYTGGARFMTSLMVIDSANRDKAFRVLPRSTEQVLHPDKFATLDFDAPTSFSLADNSPDLGDGWALSMSNVMGEFQSRLLFEEWRQWEMGRRASRGWDGDRYHVYRRGNGEYLLSWVSAWDTEQDADEFFSGFSELMRDKVYRTRFRGREFEGDVFVRMLSWEPPADSRDMPVYMRFRKAGRSCIVQISNSTDAMDTALSWDQALFETVDQALGRESARSNPPLISADVSPSRAQTTATD